MSHIPQQRNDPHPRYAIVFETEHGCVTRCACCGCLAVRFGNALLAVQPDELDVVLATLRRMDGSAGGRADDDGRPHETVLYMGEGGCGWVFSRAETVELHRLVAGARLLLDVQVAVPPEAPDAGWRDDPA